LRILGSSLLWHGLVRAVIFWSAFGAGLTALAEFAPYSQWQHVFNVLREVSAGKIDHVSEKTFAFALSSGEEFLQLLNRPCWKMPDVLQIAFER
jgi:hypothetical protein